MRRLLPLLLLCACVTDDTVATDTDTAPAVDLVTPLDATQVRAGVITDPAALVGGIAAEARPGDVMLRNHRARFIIQGANRASGGMVPVGGGVIDADLVRDDGTADADLVVDWMTALDVGWLASAQQVDVLDDGQDSGTAVVQVQAHDVGFAYFEAVLENPGANAPRGLDITTTYTLRPDSPLLHVQTTLTASEAVTLRPGDILQALPGITSPWVPGVGRVNTPRAAEDAVMVTHHEHGLTLGIFADDTDASATPELGLDLLNFIVSFTSLYEPTVSLAAGASFTWSRWWGVGPDPASLTDAWQAATGAPSRGITATVTDGSAPIAGARVTVLVDDAPFTLALTDAQGQVSLQVPPQGEIRLVADGSGSHIVRDLPAGAGDASPLAQSLARDASLTSLRDGATPTPHARGYGRTEGAEGEPLTLTPPGTVRLTADDGGPFEARLRRVDGEPASDALSLPAPGGYAALGYGPHGEVAIPLEPGTYDLMAWRGTWSPVQTQRIEVTSGDTTPVSLSMLTHSPRPAGWWTADTHSHAAPSFDGKMSPTDRALVSACTGLDLWIASEHDVAVDHTGLVRALELDDRLRVLGSLEVTPWVRGHVNLFPNTADPDARAGGAWPWWEHLRPTTTEQFELMKQAHPESLVQINHPFSPGMPSLAGWEPGLIASPDLWWDGFDALEVVVPGQDVDGLNLYMDLSARGVLSAATGSSDSHDHLQNSPGMLKTWLYAPGPTDAGDLTDADIVTAFTNRHTLASNGPFLHMDPLPGSTVAPGTRLTVRAMGPTWVQVDRIHVYKDGVLLDTIPLDEAGEATLLLDADADASFVIEGRGDAPMAPIQGRGGWVVASAIQVDVGGDGWTPPLPPLGVK